MSQYQSNAGSMDNTELNLDADFTSAEQLLASLGMGDIELIEPLPIPDTFDSTFKYIAQDSAAFDWNYGVEGLLPPLKRPDPNQMPTDVLNYLINSGKFAEILNFNQTDGCSRVDGSQNASSAQTGGTGNVSTENNVQGHSNWPAQNDTQSSTQPNWSQGSSDASGVVDSNPQLTTSTNSTSPQLQKNTFQFNFSANAPEFVPRQNSPKLSTDPESSTWNDGHGHEALRMAIAQVNQIENFEQLYKTQHQRNQIHRPSPTHQQRPQHQYFSSGPLRGGGFRPQRYSNSYQQHQPRQRHFRPTHYASPGRQEPSAESNIDRVLTSVTDTIAHLTANPADFNMHVKRTVRVLKESLFDSDTLDIVVTLIVEQSVANKNFSYTGAKLCQALNEHNIRAGDLTAQRCVMAHVQKVFDSSLKSIQTTSDELRERHIGLLFFLAELFVHFKMDSGISFFGFGVAVIEIMQKLIQREKGKGVGNSFHDNIKSVVNILKLAGWELEQHKNPKLKEEMAKLIKDLACIHLIDEDVPEQTKQLIGKVFDLKKINWGRGEEEEEPSTASGTTKSESPPPTVTYDGKSQTTIYEAPPSSDDDEIYLDDESEEVNKFYDQFIPRLFLKVNLSCRLCLSEVSPRICDKDEERENKEGTRVESRSRIPLLFYSSWKSESGENSIFHYLNFLLRNSREKEKNQMNNSNPLVHIYEPLLTTGEEKSVIRHYLRKKRGFFDKAHEKQRLEEEYDRSFRLFWFLGGVAIVFFICIFILTLLCFCCPNLTKKGKKTSIPRISTTIEPDMDGPISSELLMNRLEVERARSASVFSTNALYIPHHRLSQEQVNTIQIQSQSRRGSQLPSTSQGLTVSSALIDVSVIHEQRPDTIVIA